MLLIMFNSIIKRKIKLEHLWILITITIGQLSCTSSVIYDMIMNVWALLFFNFQVSS